MLQSRLFRSMASEVKRLGRTYLNFKQRPSGNYTKRQLSAGAAYTLFCHAEIESYLEAWASELTEYAEKQWIAGTITRPLAHLCTFHPGRAELTTVPSKDIWNVQFKAALMQHHSIIAKNNGIKEHNICALFAPLGFDVRRIDTVLIADLNAFGTMRGGHAHQSHKVQIGTTFDPFDRQAKAGALVAALTNLDRELIAYRASV